MGQIFCLLSPTYLPQFGSQNGPKVVKIGQNFGGARSTSQGHISKYPKPFPVIVVSFCSLWCKDSNDPLMARNGSDFFAFGLPHISHISGPKMDQNGQNRSKFWRSKVNFPGSYLEVAKTISGHCSAPTLSPDTAPSTETGGRGPGRWASPPPRLS